MSAQWKWNVLLYITAITCSQIVWICWTSRRFCYLIFPIAIQQFPQVSALIALYSTLCHDSLVTRCLLAIINFESYFLVMLGKCAEVGLAWNTDEMIFQGLNANFGELFCLGSDSRKVFPNVIIDKFLEILEFYKKKNFQPLAKTKTLVFTLLKISFLFISFFLLQFLQHTINPALCVYSTTR